MRIIIEDLGVPGVLAGDTIFLQPGQDPTLSFSVIRTLLPDLPAEQIDALLSLPV